MAPGKCSSAMFQIHGAPSPRTTTRWALFKPRRTASALDARTKLLGRFDRSHIGCGLFVALRSALIIHAGLGEDASEFSFAGFRPAGFVLTFAPFRFVRHDRHTGSIHGSVERSDRLDTFQLSGQGRLPLLLTGPFDLLANRFRHSLDGFGFDDD